MKLVSSVVLLGVIITVSQAAKLVIKSGPDPNDQYFENENFIFSKDVKDNKQPTIFTGDPMKAKLTASLLESKRDGFHNAYGTVNGIEVESVGKLKETDTGKALIVSGSYSYTGADGKRYRVRYTADEFGYHPKTELELEIPDPSARKERGPDPQLNIQKFKNRDNENTGRSNTGNNNGGNDNNDPSVNGYSYDKPESPNRLYLPPIRR